uniref:Auxin responsive protein n=1 Tax=Oryza brachyantha TaxID=4533 RepID=J3M1F7_ORYBR
MVSWRRSRVVAGQEACERLVPGGGGEKAAAAAAVPRGCVALVLVGDGGGGGERVVVEVRALERPRVGALLEKAAREFGYDQKGVLRVPCTADELRQAVAADSAAGASSFRRR